MITQERDGLLLSDDASRLDVALVHHWLSDLSYWAAGRSLDIVGRSIERSWCLGVYSDAELVAFTRVVTDEVTIAWICDVFVTEEYRGRGIGTWMARVAVDRCAEAGVRRILLATSDAHGVYSKVGFRPLVAPERWMEIDLHST